MKNILISARSNINIGNFILALYSFCNDFIDIIVDEAEKYEGNKREKLREFFDNVYRGTGNKTSFIYDRDNKEFYKFHGINLEIFLNHLRGDQRGLYCNPQGILHQNYIVRTCFEGFCGLLQNEIFDNENEYFTDSEINEINKK